MATATFALRIADLSKQIGRTLSCPARQPRQICREDLPTRHNHKGHQSHRAVRRLSAIEHELKCAPMQVLCLFDAKYINKCTNTIAISLKPHKHFALRLDNSGTHARIPLSISIRRFPWSTRVAGRHRGHFRSRFLPERG